MSEQSALSPARYSAGAILLHWALAALLLFQLALGWRLEDLPKGAAQFTAFQLHKSVGISILLLSLARLGLRLAKPRPAEAEASPAIRWLARTVHTLLYGVMIGGPLTGWIMVSTAKVKLSTMLFGTVPWPHLPLSAGWNGPAKEAHALLAFLLVGLVALHVAGALKHHLQRDDLIGRMMPRAVAGRSALTAGVMLALLGAGAAFAAGWLIPFGGGAASAPAVAATAAAPVAEQTAAASTAASADASEAASEAASQSASAAAVPWTLEPGGRLGFRADYTGSPVDGTFKRWDADIVFSPDDLEHSRIKVSVDLASAETADATRDDMLRSDSFFGVAAHPQATFTSTRIRKRGSGYSAAGTLSLHGVSRPLTVNFDLVLSGERANASGSAQLQRSLFGVGSGEWAGTGEIKDAVAVSFRLKARRR